MRSQIIVTVAVLCSVVLAAEQTAPGQTVLEWRQAGQKASHLTLYADGTFANAKGQTKNYRWWWTEETLVIKFYSGRFVLTPVPGEAGRFTGQSVPRTPADPVSTVDVTVRQPDGAGILAWLQPLWDGLSPSAVERRAAAEAHNTVVRKLHALGGKLDAATTKANRAAASLSALGAAEAAAGDRVEVRGAKVHVARHEEWEALKWYNMTKNPWYSWGTWANARADWKGWESRRQNAEADLSRARADMSKATDRRLRADADLRVAEAEYIIARSDYESAYWLAWRPEYLKRKAMLKAEADAARLRTSRPRPSSPS